MSNNVANDWAHVPASNIEVTMKTFTFYYTTENGEAKKQIKASNNGIAINRFKQSVTDCLKILKIEKE